jgi:hypothetical protein
MRSQFTTAVRIAAVCMVASGTTTMALGSDTPIVVGAAVGGSSQSVGESDRPYLGPGFGGTVWSAIAFGDAILRGRLSIGGEASLNGNLTGEQSERVSGGANQLLSQHRDGVFSVVVKVRSSPTSRFQIAAGAGVGVSRRHTERTGTFVRDFPTGTGTPVTEILTDNVVALSGAVDLSFSLSRHMGICGLVRIYRMVDDDRLPDGVVKRGVSSVIVRYGAGGQFRF